jgi:hypothetical protein
MITACVWRPRRGGQRGGASQATISRPGADKQQGDLGAGGGGDRGDHQGDRPQATVVLVGEAGELDRGQGDDGHDRVGDAVKQRLDGGQALVADVDGRDGEHDQKRGGR